MFIRANDVTILRGRFEYNGARKGGGFLLENAFGLRPSTISIFIEGGGGFDLDIYASKSVTVRVDSCIFRQNSGKGMSIMVNFKLFDVSAPINLQFLNLQIDGKGLVSSSEIRIRLPMQLKATGFPRPRSITIRNATMENVGAGISFKAYSERPIDAFALQVQDVLIANSTLLGPFVQVSLCSIILKNLSISNSTLASPTLFRLESIIPHVLCVDTCLLYTSPSPRDS
eukprot:TRINITY_DN7042_c0_g1_i1.p1 TRINITY_DN7042_c0_g1~~TRINITY_DN7042_c0_g1_i1.p1  ORF type:complete len:228 (+),score=36.58 TRINITY_DN7042_c0_g1_i1:357-1040(+)